jgi:hypothetical protein
MMHEKLAVGFSGLLALDSFPCRRECIACTPFLSFQISKPLDSGFSRIKSQNVEKGSPPPNDV